ncbi:hypothetical protein F5Y16DRAFT_378842 [Xylariaceae sp. FL0255]|nr:hypothetical protein F5Y16DRAFT_378842 [Xylariaceae sp. FL0255]
MDTGTETLDAMQARHRKEQRDLQSRITSKRKNATKKNRKGINDECAILERELKERQERELDVLNRDRNDHAREPEGEEEDGQAESTPLTSEDTPENPATTTDTSINGVSQKLKQVRIQEPPQKDKNDQRQQQQAGEGEEQGKKRNRQKERMARRAAEQEAAAEAAETEAQGMTDHRGIEREALERTFSTHGLVEHEILPDGHCLFSAIADQLAQLGIGLVPSSLSSVSPPSQTQDKDTPPYRAVRRVATSYMASHADDFAPFMEEPLDDYVAKIRDTAEWGGQLELMAIARAYGVQVRVVQNGRTETIESGSEGEEEGKEKTLWLAYYRHGYGLGEHYNSLRKKG